MNKLALLAALMLPLFVQPAVAQDYNLSLTCTSLPLVADGFLAQHVSIKKADDKLLKRVAKIYAERLDPNETLLTEAEYEKLEARLDVLVKAVKDRKCADFAQLKKDQIAWQKDIEDYVRKTVSDKKFKIDKKRVVDLDPKKRPRPKTKKRQAELRRAFVDFQMANYIAGGVDMKEAKRKMIHRHELFTRRVEEQTEADLYGAFLNAYAAALDPHSTYFSMEDMEDFRIQMQLSLQGIGAVLTSRDGFTTVEEVVAGGAADEQGQLKPKDQIIAVTQGEKGEAVDVIDMNLRDVVRLIRGKKGTKVTLTVLRKTEKTERLTFTITRDKIDLAESAAKLEWHNVKRGKKTLKIAVIDLPSFYMGDKPGARDSAQDMTKLIAEAKKGKADGVVLDLSRNGGGVLQSAVTISGLFIERGGIVAAGTVMSKTPQVLEDRDPRVQWDGPLVVLTSKISASASEILAGALHDYGRAVIVGDEHTFGKGSVQQLSQLPPGLGMLKVTTALYYLPGGNSTQNSGVKADVIVPSPFSKLEIGEKHQENALPEASTKRFASKKANASKSWKPVSAGVIAQLKAKSAKRVASDKEFKELQKKLSERDVNDSKVKIAEILDNSADKKNDKADKEDKKKKDELTIQALEATEIVADLAMNQ